MEESDLPKKTKVTLSFTVWTGYDEMIKIEESKDAQGCLEFQRSRLEIQNKNLFSRSQSLLKLHD